MRSVSLFFFVSCPFLFVLDFLFFCFFFFFLLLLNIFLYAQWSYV